MCGTFATLKLYRTTLQSVPMFDAGFIALDIFPTSGLKFPIRIHRLHIHYQMELRKHGRYGNKHVNQKKHRAQLRCFTQDDHHPSFRASALDW